ncbi:carbamoyltransferase family protein [Flavitalea flava]
MGRNIIGISAFFHDSACCLMQDGSLKAAAEEERFTRVKADPSLPKNAFSYCLKEGSLTVKEIDCIAYYEDPEKKLARQLWSGVLGNSPDILHGADLKGKVEGQIRQVLGYEGEIKYIDHHMSHAASSFFFSGFDDSAILTVDGVGEWATTTFGKGDSTGIRIFEEVHFPDSLGLLYSTITSYLGFGVNDGEYKVMGLAPYGKAIFVDQIRQLMEIGPKGQYRLNMQYFAFLKKNRMYADELSRLFGRSPRKEDAEMEQFHKDVAKSLQVVLEEVLIDKANYLFRETGSENLCLAGGVALNCVANGQILRKGPFKRLFVQPAANDAGGAIGAAAMAHFVLEGSRPSTERLSHVYLGPSYCSNYIYRLLQSTSVEYSDFRGRKNELLQLTAARLSKGKVIGWFQGRMEFGPRSLGARSILADPRNDQMRDRINAMVKKREGFRPFAPAVIDALSADHFNLDHLSPFMLETCEVISPLQLPAITHVDNSARVQTVSRETNRVFFELLGEFYKLTGCPILLNTSFNIKGEPIVCSPEDALRCFITTDIDVLVIEDFIIERNKNNFDLLKLIIQKDRVKSNAITHDVYTFV